HGRRRKVEGDAQPGLELREYVAPVFAEIAVGQVVAAVQADRAGELLLRDVVGQAAQVELPGVVRLLAALSHHAGALLLRRERFADVLRAGDLRERGKGEQRQRQRDASQHKGEACPENLAPT